jgi:hypothetical protein
MELLKEIVPKLSREAVVEESTNPGHTQQLRWNLPQGRSRCNFKIWKYKIQEILSLHSESRARVVQTRLSCWEVLCSILSEHGLSASR